MSAHIDLCQAASDGDLLNLRAAMKQAGTRPDGKRSQTALVCAVVGNRIDAVKTLLDWGVTADSQDDQRRPALHLACSSGFAEAVRELLANGADTLATDAENNTAMSISVQGKQLQCAKALLKAGAKLEADQTCPGLPKIIAEVQLEELVDELKGFAESSSSDTKELIAASQMVWQAQKDHMRLLTMREEQKAGMLVTDLDQRLKSEMETFANAKKSEDALAKEFADLRVSLQTVETGHGLSRSQMESTELAARRAVEEEAEADNEYKAMLAELSKAQADKEAVDRDIMEKEMARDEALALANELQEQANALKSRNKELSDTLKAESGQLRGWERDQEAAAALTAKAHDLLSAGPLSPKSVRPTSSQAPFRAEEATPSSSSATDAE